VPLYRVTGFTGDAVALILFYFILRRKSGQLVSVLQSTEVELSFYICFFLSHCRSTRMIMLR